MNKLTRVFFIVGIIISILLTGCSNANSMSNYEQSWNFLNLDFHVHIPTQLAPNEKIYLELVDEISGISFNPTLFEMQKESENLYYVRIKAGQNAILKYRYAKGISYAHPEYTSKNMPVQYRLLKAQRAASIIDNVYAWNDTKFTGNSGTIQGFAVDAKTSAPIPNVLINVAGMETWTLSDGSYIIENVPVGEQRITGLHPDGDYHFFQQGAIIAKDALTPAIFSMTPSNFVNVTFKVTTPNNTPEEASLRIIGDTLSTGNIFGELMGGMSTIASRAPELRNTGKGTYEITLRLPSGSHFRYKFTIGDGFWNAERKNDANFYVREIIVPDHDITIQNEVLSWGNGNNPIVRFIITTPESTNQNDHIFIQFNPFSWMPPLPMTRTGVNTWEIELFSPMEAINEAITFRICRNALCGVADDIATRGPIQTGQPVINAMRSGIVEYSVRGWVDGLAETFPVSKIERISSSPTTIIEAFEFHSIDPLTSVSNVNWGIIQAAVNGASWIIRSPSWAFDPNMVSEEYSPPTDTFWNDEMQVLTSIREAGLKSAVFPRARLGTSVQKYWQNIVPTFDWWQKWFERFEKFTIYHADLAAISESGMLIIGGEEFWPAITGQGFTNTGNSISAKIPETNWETLISLIRKHYSGAVYLAIPYSGLDSQIPNWVSLIDGIYLQVNNEVIDTNKVEAKLYAYLSKPIVVSLNYSSGGDNGVCNPVLNAKSFNFDNIYAYQFDSYSQAINALNGKPWVSGIISGGYYSDLTLLDASCSVRGKPAEKLLSKYFNQ